MEAAIRHAEAFERVRGVIQQISSSRAFDDELYKEFRSRFPLSNVRDIRGAESLLRNKAAWTSFHARFEGRVADPSLLTLNTLNVCRGLRDLDNVVFVGRLVWLAIEVCRHREAGGSVTAAVA